MKGNKKVEELDRRISEARKIDADFMIGLSEEEVSERKKDGLINKTKKKVTKSYWQIFVDNVLTFFNMVFFTIAILMAVAQLPITSFFFLAPLCLNILIGVVADVRVRLLVEKLRVVTDEKCRVMRNGKEIEIDIDELVLSDIVVLKAGDQVPCDAYLVSGRLEMDESLLTGESEAVSKNEEDLIYSGSFVKSGKGYVRVAKVGKTNYAETIQASAKQFTRPRSEIKRSCLLIFWTTGIVAIVMGITMTITELAQYGWFDSLESYSVFIKSLSGSLVAMIPAGLYVLTSTTLAIGVYNLSREKMNVQELYCIEMLARVDTVCFDKTGTLTDGRLMVKDVHQYDDTSIEEAKTILRSLVHATGDANQTAEAIARYVGEGELIESKIAMPFDSANKYSAFTTQDGVTYILGAAENIGGKVSDIAVKDAERLMKRGYRVLSLFKVKKPIENGKIPGKSLLFCQISLVDNIKPDAKENIAWFQSSGVQVKVISGDNPLTVSEIARECGAHNAERFISMVDVENERIPELVKDYAVFGRVSPEQKALLVEALQKEGHKVAMTGDGVNDIIALKKADCSIAMASGAAAARNVAHMVSLNSDFSKLPNVVKEGRRVINNIQRTASLFLSKTTFAIVLSIVFQIANWVNGTRYPFETSHMTLWEIFTIGIGGFLLALQPSNDRLSGSVFKNILSVAVPAGITEILSVACIYLLTLFYPGILVGDLHITLCVLSFSIISLFVLYRVCQPFDRYRTFVYFGVLIAMVATVLFDRFVFYDESIFHLRYPLIGSNDYGSWVLLMVGGTVVACLLVYLLLTFIVDRFVLKKRKEDEKE